MMMLMMIFFFVLEINEFGSIYSPSENGQYTASYTVSFLMEYLLVFFLYFACIVHSKHGCSPLWSSWWTAAAGSDDTTRMSFLFLIMSSFILMAGKTRHGSSLFLLAGGVPVWMFAPDIPSRPIRTSDQHSHSDPNCLLACTLACWLDVRVLEGEKWEVKLYQMLNYGRSWEESWRRVRWGLPACLDCKQWEPAGLPLSKLFSILLFAASLRVCADLITAVTTSFLSLSWTSHLVLCLVFWDFSAVIS